MRPDHSFHWQVLASERISSDKWLPVRKEMCQMPNGEIVTPYYVIDYQNWANIVAFTPDHSLIITRQYRHGIGKTLNELPSGTIEAGEDPLVAAQRELKEETGYTGAEWQSLGRMIPNSASQSNWNYIFLAQNVMLTHTPNLDRTEDIEVLVLPKTEIIELIANPEWFPGLHYAALLCALRELGKLELTL